MAEKIQPSDWPKKIKIIQPSDWLKKSSPLIGRKKKKKKIQPSDWPKKSSPLIGRKKKKKIQPSDWPKKSSPLIGRKKKKIQSSDWPKKSSPLIGRNKKKNPALWLAEKIHTHHRSGGCSRKRVQQTLNLTLTSELTYSEMGYSEYSVPEQRIWVSCSVFSVIHLQVVLLISFVHHIHSSLT